ncbi:Flagellar basal-body rod protein FlgG [Pseudodesulfovibrio hydrargyri]|uniref:Flagellar basal-body rod protein FlgG n=1 Tax=Pseudodesulfovibrio hydrargyri TaxID=2125990 RepID=A0A1J5MZE3_9BACT|nr:flagellar hook basal-body protein [Pseudodesulfovibrio hydrargyri]OIQ51362.1 Flagellar basal-body rod protein FlgG [Pseudodesulfovibrio hydrargyri]
MRDCTQSAIFGALSNELRMSSIANNLANVNTSAFKKDKLAFHDTFVRFAHDYLVDERTYIRGKKLFPEGHIMAKARLSAQQADLSQGSLENTGNQLDFAVSGPGFFSIQGDNEMLYTRAGNFVTDADGMLRTVDGNPVMVDGGPLVIPQGGRVQVDDEGNVMVNGVPAGAFDLVDFPDPTQLERVGSNSYRGLDGAVGVPSEDAEVAQGFIEKSNVEVVTEMVSMIETQRAFTMYTKMIQADNELDNKLITQVGRPTV